MFDPVVPPMELLERYMIITLIPILFAFTSVLVSLIIRKGK